MDLIIAHNPTGIVTTITLLGMISLVSSIIWFGIYIIFRQKNKQELIYKSWLYGILLLFAISFPACFYTQADYNAHNYYIVVFILVNLLGNIMGYIIVKKKE